MYPDGAMIQRMLKGPPQPETLLGLMDSLSDPTRLRLLRLLERHELGVVELCEVLQMPQSTVSRHLKVLADQGWVHARRQGTTHLYRMILDELDAPTRKLWLLAREQTDEWATTHQDELRLAQRLADRQRDAQAFFAGAAGEWDALRQELYGDAFTVQAVLAMLPATYVVADLGCGTGAVSEMVAPHVARLYAIDNSAAMLKAARKRVGERENVELRRGDLESLPLENAACDAALLLLVLTYTAEPQRVLSEEARILKPGGRVVVVDLLPHDREDFRRQMGQQRMGFSGEEMKQIMAAAGLTPGAVRALPPEPDAKGPALFLATGTRM
jgi:ArsR family transcriptional regulator